LARSQRAPARDLNFDAEYMQTEPAKPTDDRVHHLAGKYLTFTLHQESYGIDVLKVREIIRRTEITTLPQMPDYVRGVINLRGKIIPVMDLRLRFGLPEAQTTEQACIVVAQVKLPGGKSTQMGMVVDGVEEVVNIAAADLEETPRFGVEVSTECILAMAKVKGVVKTLLDIDRVVGNTTAEVQASIG